MNSPATRRPRRWILLVLVAGAFSLQGCHTFWYHIHTSHGHHAHHHAHHRSCR